MSQKATRKKPSREAMIRALVTSGSVTAAATEVGCSRSTIYRALQEEAFVDALEEARERASDAELDALVDLRRRQCGAAREAFNFLAEMLADSTADIHTRIGVAKTLLKGADPASEQLARWSLKRRDRLSVEEALVDAPGTRAEAQALGLVD